MLAHRVVRVAVLVVVAVLALRAELAGAALDWASSVLGDLPAEEFEDFEFAAAMAAALIAFGLCKYSSPSR